VAPKGDRLTYAGPTTGGSLLKTIVALAVLAALVAVGIQAVPAYFNNSQFSDYIRDRALRATVERSPSDVIQAEVVHYAQELGVPVDASEVEVTSSGGTVSIQVNYSVPVNLGVTTWNIHFSPSAISREY
jgi:hypothetical protein